MGILHHGHQKELLWHLPVGIKGNDEKTLITAGSQRNKNKFIHRIHLENKEFKMSNNSLFLDIFM